MALTKVLMPGMVEGTLPLSMTTGNLPTSRIDNIPLNVKDYGAVGDGVTDDTVALRNAFAACFPSTPTYTIGGVDYYRATNALYIPPGQYKVTGTIYCATDLSSTKKFIGFSLYGNPASIQYNPSTSFIANETAIIADSDTTWADNQAVIDLQYMGWGNVSSIAVFGSYGNTKGIDFSQGGWWTVRDVTISQHKYGAYHNNSGGLNLDHNQYSYCSHAGLYLKDSGDSNIVNCYVNTNNPDYSIDQNQGWGIFLATSNNTNIHGGKIEYNAIGIHAIDNNGINIQGINFDENYQTHIYVTSESTSTSPAPYQAKSITIVGNRFLGGGFNNGTLGKSAISVFAASSNSYVTITGNSFRKGSGLAYDENTGGAQPVGPNNILYCYHDAGTSSQINNYAVSGNDMWNGAVVNTVIAVANGGANVSFRGINVRNMNSYSEGANVSFANFLN